MQFPLIISFYTPTIPYQLYAYSLKQSCEKFNLPFCIEAVDSWGSWELNCGFKPFFILQKLLQFNQPILWVDCDASFVRQPSYLSVFEHDLSVYIDPILPKTHPSKVRSGTIYLKPTKPAIDALRRWICESKKQLTNSARKIEFWDQEALKKILFNDRILCWSSLPLDYVYIMKHPKDSKLVLNPVIVHCQASRYKKNNFLNSKLS